MSGRFRLFSKNTSSVKASNKNQELSRKKLAIKHLRQMLLIIVVSFILLLISNLIEPKDSDTSFMDDERIEQLYSFLEPYLDEETKAELTTQEDSEIIVNNNIDGVPCVVEEVLNDTTLVVKINKESFYVCMTGIESFEYKDRLDNHVTLMNSLLGKVVYLTSDNMQETKIIENELFAYVLLADGSCLNNVLLEKGFVCLDINNTEYGLYNDFYESAQKSYTNKSGYWQH